MPWQRSNWKLIVVVSAVSLVALIAIHVVWQRMMLEGSLLRSLRKDADVLSVTLETSNNKSIALIELKNVDRLATTIRRLESISETGRPHLSEIIWKDNSSPRLDQLYQEMHYALYEARLSGAFVLLSTRVNEAVSLASIDGYVLEVDDNALYLELYDAEHYLYRVIPLPVSP